MTLARATRITGVKARRTEQRLLELQRCRRQVVDAEQALADAIERVEQFKRDRQTVQHQAYAQICGEELSKADLRNLNQKLDTLLEQEKTLDTSLGDVRESVAFANDQLRQALMRFHAAQRNREKWELMIKPMQKSAKRDEERKAEVEREDQLLSMPRPFA